MDFRLITSFSDSGDQPEAIRQLSTNITKGTEHQVLLGVTGSGKTYTMARVIEEVQMPTLIISHNKTLTAQLYSEFKSFFPENAVEYFVSYYDYYQPEAYIPQKDVYIEKDSKINDQIDRLRLKATSSLFSRKDVIIVASVSCIYGLGSPEEWEKLIVSLHTGQVYSRSGLAADLASIQYVRNDIAPGSGNFRIRGNVIDIFPAYLQREGIRVMLGSDNIESIYSIDPLTGKKTGEYDSHVIYPASHFVTSEGTLRRAEAAISEELEESLGNMKAQGKLLEAQRLRMRTEYDIEMLRETGYCSGIENYSRHISERSPGAPPYCLINYFPRPFLTIIDESHVMVPQLRGMYAGDRSRKEVLVEHGFRLPSALDNRPLKFDEFNALTDKTVYVSATPADYETGISAGFVIEQLIRPTGLTDPEVEIRPVSGQVDDLKREISVRASKDQRTLVTTLTKKMAEDLCEYFNNKGMRVRYLHSEIDTLERINILKDLRKGHFDCLVGVNLLREGLDLPEVTLVAILDADKEGFLRSQTSIVQVCGRAARNIDGRVIMYADNITGSIARAVQEMSRRRRIQLEYNKKHGVMPRSIVKAIREEKEFEYDNKRKAAKQLVQAGWQEVRDDFNDQILSQMEQEMKEAADKLDFEMAAHIRDRIFELSKRARMKKGRRTHDSSKTKKY